MTKKNKRKDPIEIIDNPSLRSVLRRFGEWIFTTVMWVLWAYLFFPIINIILWALGIASFYEKVVEPYDYFQLLDLVQNCGLMVLGIFLLLWFWGVYNYRRFGRRNRRFDSTMADPGEMAEFFDVSVDRVLELRQQKEIKWTSLYIAKKDQSSNAKI
jgi:poly-beta-1,6-N-acetyl-D-glucosamine biosynthesis protein PgaD